MEWPVTAALPRSSPTQSISDKSYFTCLFEDSWEALKCEAPRAVTAMFVFAVMVAQIAQNAQVHSDYRTGSRFRFQVSGFRFQVICHTLIAMNKSLSVMKFLNSESTQLMCNINMVKTEI